MCNSQCYVRLTYQLTDTHFGLRGLSTLRLKCLVQEQKRSQPVSKLRRAKQKASQSLYFTIS